MYSQKQQNVFKKHFTGQRHEKLFMYDVLNSLQYRAIYWRQHVLMIDNISKSYYLLKIALHFNIYLLSAEDKLMIPMVHCSQLQRVVKETVFAKSYIISNYLVKLVVL